MRNPLFVSAFLFALVLLSFIAPRVAAADDKEWSVTVDLTYSSKYIWRGLNFNDDPVIWPSVTGSWKGLSLIVWASIETSDYNSYPDNDKPSGDITEIDYTLDYSFAIEKFSFSVGLALYEYPTTGLNNTIELYAVAGYDTLLSPKILVYQDLDEAKGTWISLAASHSFDLYTFDNGMNVSLGLSASIGYGTAKDNEYYFGLKESALTDFTLHATLPFQISDNWALTVAFHYSTLLDSDHRKIMEKDDNFWTTISLTATF